MPRNAGGALPFDPATLGPVDGVFAVDLRVDDRRVPAIEQVRIPAVVIGSPGGAGTPARDRAGRPAVNLLGSAVLRELVGGTRRVSWKLIRFSRSG